MATTLRYTVAGTDRRLSEPNEGQREKKPCRLMDPEIWYPDSTRITSGPLKGKYTEGAAHAISLCHTCPFIVSCQRETMRAEDGQALGNRHGIAGGMDPVDRWHLDHRLNGKRPGKANIRTPLEDAAPLRKILKDARRRYPTDASLYNAISEATGISTDTLRMVHTGVRKEVRVTTGSAIRAWDMVPDMEPLGVPEGATPSATCRASSGRTGWAG